MNENQIFNDLKWKQASMTFYIVHSFRHIPDQTLQDIVRRNQSAEAYKRSWINP